MALKDELIQKALRRSKPNLKRDSSTKYNHFKIYEIPPTEDINIIETESDTNRTQIEHKPDTQQNINRTQIGHKSSTNRTQTKDSDPSVFKNRAQTEHATGHITEHKPDTNQTQTEHKIEEEIKPISFSACVGLQRNILFLFYSDCKISRSRETQEISLQHIADSLKIPIGSVKTSIRRLEEKKAIKRIRFKIGRSGWSSYTLEDNIYREIMQYETSHKNDTNRTQIGHKTNTQPDTQSDTSASSSSSFKDLKTTTTEETASATIYEWLKEIDIEPLRDFGFSINTLRQLTPEQGLTPDEIQESINAFAFDLIENGTAKTVNNPVSYLMKGLKKGIPYVPPPNYEAPKDKAMRLCLERKKETEKRRIEMEEEALKLACGEWLESLSEEEKNNIVSQQDEKDNWRKCIKHIQEKHEKHIFDTWIKPLHPVNENGKWVLFAPNNFVKDEASKIFSSIFQTFLGKFTIEVGHANLLKQYNATNCSPEVLELRKYFKENLWSKKRSEFLAGV